MVTALLIIHLLVTLSLIGVVLIQRSEGGGLGVGTSQGMGGFMSGRGTANLLTRTTAILGTLFFVLSMALALLNRGTTVNNTRSIMDVAPGRPASSASPALTPNPVRGPAAPPAAAPVEPAAPPAATAAPPATRPVPPAATPQGADPALPALPDAPPPPPADAPR